MMLEQVRAESSKRAVSNIVVTIFLIVILILGILIFWAAMRKIISKSPEVEINCIDLISSLVIKKTCYLNENELLIDVKRGFDDVDIDKLRFSFDSVIEGYIWDITGKKCSDARITEKYGGYCEIIKQGQELNYVFNVSGIEKLKEIKLGAGSGEKLCSIAELEIKNSC